MHKHNYVSDISASDSRQVNGVSLNKEMTFLGSVGRACTVAIFPSSILALIRTAMLLITLRYS